MAVATVPIQQTDKENAYCHAGLGRAADNTTDLPSHTDRRTVSIPEVVLFADRFLLPPFYIMTS